MTGSAVRVPARVGLLGNPSDGFGGRVIAMTVDALAASVIAEPAACWELLSPARSREAASVAELDDALERDQLDEGLELLAATIVRLAAELADLTPCRLAFETTIPRQVGLSGSSAIVVGSIRALAAAGGREMAPTEVARLALATEVEVLGWAAGPQDRVVQAHGGVLDMRFDVAWDPARYERLDPGRLPPLVVAWDPRPGTSSGSLHAPVRDRWLADEADVVAAMTRFAGIAAAGRAAIDADRAAEVWPALALEAWELRTRHWPVSDRDRAMVDAVRASGGGATLAGSGGAIVGYLPSNGRLDDACSALSSIGARAMVPLSPRTGGRAPREP
jgi:glucuronokinase